MFEATKNPGRISGTNYAASRARDDAAKVFKVGVNAVQQAKAVLADAPGLEKAFKAVGPEGTLEQFNRALGRDVSADTSLLGKHDGGFEQARNAFHRSEGIGRSSIAAVLP